MSTTINDQVHPTSVSDVRFSTLVELLRTRSLMQPDQIAYTFLTDGETEGPSLTYAELDRQARAVAAALDALGVTRGQTALLLYPPGLEFIVGFFGCLYAGVVAIPAYPPDPARLNRTLPRLQAIIADARATVALTTSPLLKIARQLFAQAEDLRVLPWLATDAVQAGAEDDWHPVEVTSETLAFLQYTSGSTGVPKGVMLRHSHMLHNAGLVFHGFEHTTEDKYVSWLPTFHDMGLMAGVIQPLYAGIPSVLLSPVAFLQRPLLWLQAVSRHRATTSGGPNFAYDLCVRKTTPQEREALDLSSWRVAFNGAEPVRAETLERFAETFAASGFRREAFYPCYGLAEATLIISGGYRRHEPVVRTFDAGALGNLRAVAAQPAAPGAKTLVGVGRVLPDQRVAIVAPDTLTECAPGQLGEIWVAGPSVASGYWGRVAETEQIFNAHLLDTGEGPFMRTGDKGFIDDGELFIAGRIKDLIIIRGLNHYPQDIELTCDKAHPVLKAGCGAAFAIESEGEEKLAFVQEVDARGAANYDEVIEAIREAVAKEHDLSVCAVTLIKPGTIPKTSSGKIQRHAAREGLLQNTLASVAAWRAPAAPETDAPMTTAPPINVQAIQTLLASQTEAIQTWLVAQLSVALGLNPRDVDVQQPIVRYGLDSLAAIELMHGIETSLGVRLPMTSFLAEASIAQLAAEALKQLTATAAAPTFQPPEPRVDAEYPLSQGQRGLWFLHQLAPESTAYNIMRAVRINSEVDPSALRRAFQALVYRHAALRTTFEIAENGEPLQRVHEHAEVSFVEEDAANWSDELLDERLTLEALRPFNLQQCPLLRVSLLTRGPRDHVMLLAVHHIVSDLWSLTVLLQELGQLYDAEVKGTHAALAPLNQQYADYVRWQSELLAGAEGAKLKAYWQETLAGELPVLNLPTDRPRPPVQTYKGSSFPFRLDAELTRAVKQLGREHGVTLYMTLLAAFQTLLHRYTQQDDVLVGCPIVGRGKAEWGRLVGYFVNPLIVRATFAPETSFAELLQQVRGRVLEAFNHQDYPFTLLVESLQPERDPSRAPLFQAMLVLQKSHLLNDAGLSLFALGEAGARMRLGTLELESMPLDQRAAQLDLTLMLAEVGDELAATLEYNTDLFDQATIARFAEHFQQLLAAAAAAPEMRVARLSLLGASERRQLLADWNETADDYGPPCGLHELFEAQAARTPDAQALVSADASFSYGELNLRADRMARRLRAAGVGPETRVGVMLGRTSELLVAILGVLKAGGAYVPLDPAYPRGRLAGMVADAQPVAIVTSGALAELTPDGGWNVVLVEEARTADDGQADEFADEQAALAYSPGDAGGLAYVLYTSGSTGTPKGVAIEHRSAFMLINWARHVFPHDALAGVLAATSINFDLSVFELFVPLSCGGCVILADDALHLAELPAAEQVTLVNTVPSAMAELLRLKAVPASVRTINLAGEALQHNLAQQVYAQEHVRSLFNLYGPTETTTYSTYTLVDRDSPDSPTIGRPIANTQVYILDEEQQPVPVGVGGELYIGGEGIARGYLNRPDLTAERFIAHPFSQTPGARLYRTGDLVRYRANGDIEFLGRRDHQVKLRGFRIELGEIEAALGQHPDIKQSAVTVYDEAGANKQIVGYVVASNEPAPTSEELRAFLKQRLPEYMIPGAVVALAALPLTPNGKLNRRALPAPPARPAPLESAAPRTPVEAALCQLWSEVLGIHTASNASDNGSNSGSSSNGSGSGETSLDSLSFGAHGSHSGVGIHDNFFDLGGHSLLATQVVSRLRAAFSVELPLRTLFERPTVSALAEAVEEGLRAAAEVADGTALSTPPPVRRLERAAGAALPLSFAQQRLWFLDQLEPGSPFYHIPAAVRVRGPLDAQALERAVNGVVARHEALRTTFVAEGGEPRQLISPTLTLELPVMDVRHLAVAERERAAQELATEAALEPFALTEGPLLRVRLVRLAEEEHLLAVVMHHIVSDGWSVGVFVRELATGYEAAMKGAEQGELPELVVQYADYAGWQREWLRGERLEGQLGYWRERLEGAPALLELPTDRARPPAQSFRGAQLQFQLSDELSAMLRRLSQQENTTLYMTLLAAFQTLLYRYTGQADISIGTPVAGRNHYEFESLIGFFVNTLVLRTDLSGEPTFREVLQRVREVCLGAYAHQDVPFERLVEELQPERTLSHTPLFQVMFALQNAPGGALEFAGLRMDATEIETGTAKFDLTLTMEERAGALTGVLTYNTDLFDGATAERFAAHFRELLAGVAAEPTARLAYLPLLTAPEEQKLLAEWNAPVLSPAVPQCLHELFGAQAERTPGNVAVTCEGRHLTYAELNQEANQLAHRLRRLGVRAESRVGILLERSTEMIVAMLAVMKAGGAYVPLDPAYPRERLSYILENAQPVVLLTRAALKDRFPLGAVTDVIYLDADREAIAGESSDAPESGVTGDNAAYIIYTSGSTGRPKGVVVNHTSVSRLLTSTEHWFRFREDDVWTMFHSYAFDFSVWEMWGALLYGARLVVVPYLVSRSAEAFYELLCAERVTMLSQTPTAFRALIQAEEAAGGNSGFSLRTVVFGGEALDFQSLRPWLERHGDERPQLVNMYGITETTVHTTYRPISLRDLDGGPRSFVGVPIPDLQTYILDEQMQLVPAGVTGELYVGGAGLARGYEQQPELTAQRFVPHPFSRQPGARLYKSGDLARYAPDGDIEYLGRRDQQVKVRGFRIELGEIEAALGQHPGVRQVVVLATEHGPDDKRLVAYVVADEGSAPTVRELRAYLKDKLPEYMVPQALVLLAGLPLTSNGKLDRAALPAPDFSDDHEASSVPRTPVESMLCELWAEVLGHGSVVGIHSNFFDLGGHSLLATQVVARARSLFGVELPLRTLFERPTVAELAEAVEDGLRDGAPPAPPLTRLERGDEPPPLSFAQQRLWFLDQLEPGSPFYNVAGAVRLSGPLDAEALRRAVNAVVRRHEVLRTTFTEAGGEARQVIAPELELDLPATDLRHLPRAKREQAAQELGRAEAIRPFDLATGPLLRLHLAQVDDAEHVLSVVMHHIVSDGWSLGVLVEELAPLYAAALEGREAVLHALPVQYADFAAWQRGWLQGAALDAQLAYWKRQLGGELPVLNLPVDRPRPATQSYRGAQQPFHIPADVARHLRTLSQREGVTLYMTLLAAFQSLLQRYARQDEILVGTPIAGRTQKETESLIGFFVNTLVLRTDLSGEPTFREVLQRVREVCLGAYAHQDVPFERLVEELQPERTLSHTPLFQVLFTWQNTPHQELALPGLTLGTVEIETGTAKFDLTLTMEERAGALTGVLTYNTDLFDAETAERFAAHFRQLLAGVAADPGVSVARVPLLSGAEMRELLAASGETVATDETVASDETGAQGISPRRLHELFAAQVARTPESVALICGERQLTYAELDLLSGRLAHRLRAVGVRAESRVGILLERSNEMIVSMLAVMKAGGAYVPLDPAYPRERLAALVADAQPTAVITDGPLAELLAGSDAATVLTEDALREDRAATADRLEAGDAGMLDGAGELAAGELAYVLYTSGSTGTPKGVAVGHAQIVNYVESIVERLELSAGMSFALVSTPAADLGYTSIYPALCTGGALHVFTQEQATDPTAYAAYCATRRIDCLKIVPSHLAALLSGPRPEQVLPSRRLVLGGEACNWELIEQVRALAPDCAIYNHYGPTETTVGVLTNKLELAGAERRGPAPALGRPIANTQVYVLDTHLQLLPPGVPGELYVGGAGLARGYFNAPELTAERFIAHPFSETPGARLYKTGDLARRLPDGTIEFLGRIDEQVKLRGFRVEPGEIESILRQRGEVAAAVAVVREDVPGDKRLVAYVVGADEATIDTTQLQTHLRERLPEYMVPLAVVALAALPLTPNGKLNRRALPAPPARPAPLESAAPRTPVEAALCQLWSEVLGIHTGTESSHIASNNGSSGSESSHGNGSSSDSNISNLGVGSHSGVGIHDNFFDLGGHSLLATQVVSRLRAAFSVELPLRTLFERPTVAALAEAVEEGLRSAAETAEGVAHATPPPVTRLERTAGEALPLSFAQQRLWFLDQLEPGSPFYHIPAAVRVRGPLDAQALERAVNGVVARHEALRTTFVAEGGEPRQLIHAALTIELPVRDVRHLAVAERERAAQELATEAALEPFALTEGPLLRVRLVRLAEEEHLLAVVMHHIVSDGWSVGVFVRELAAGYEAALRSAQATGQSEAGETGELRELAELAELPVQYADYAGWQREWLRGERLEAQLGYWRERLEGAPALLELPTDRARPPAQSFRGAQHPVRLSSELTRQIKALGRAENTTLYMTLLAAFNVLLRHYTNQEDIVVGSDIANRNRIENEGLIGFLSNMLVLRTDLSGDPTFKEVLQRVREMALGAYAHQDVPFEKLVEVLQPKRELSYAPLFQTVFTLQNAPRQTLHLAGLSLDWYPLDTGTAKFDMVFNMWDTSAELAGLVDFNTDLFDRSSITRMLGHFETVLALAVANPERRISELSPLSEATRQEFLYEWNRTAAPYPAHDCMHELFAAQAERTPDKVAVESDGAKLTYTELNRQANQLAHHLKKQGVAPGARVGIFMEHSPEEIVGLLAVMKAGGAYVPLEPAHPAARLAHIITDAGLSLILTQERMAARLPESDARLLSVDADGAAVAEESAEELRGEATPSDSVYVIYTSGSTGQPKGVQIAHRALVNYIWWAKDAYARGEEVGFALYSSLAFDLTVTSIYVPLLTGNPVVIYSWEGREAPLDKILGDDRTGVLKLTPSHLSLIKEWDNSRSSVKRLIVGGESLDTQLAREVQASFGREIEILNEYGPTEATVGCMLYRFDPARDTRASVPIGRPAANVQIYVLDKWLNPVAENVVGELYIAGDGLAQGYLDRPELTAERFVANPFDAGRRMYRTGDLCRRLPNGELEYLGRQDEQVKFHGYRVELNEIQLALKKHPQVRDSVVLIAQDKHGHDAMIGYYVSRRELDVAELRAFLAGILIEETIPNVFVHLKKLPLTLNGKVNVQALPTLEEARQKLQRAYVAPRTPQEEVLASIWAEVLGVGHVGVHDNFFELGGHSLLATQLISRVRELLKVELPLRVVFEAQTVAGLGAKIEAALKEGVAAEVAPLVPAPRTERLPLSFAQQRLWFLDQLNPGSAAYNVPAVISLRGTLRVDALEHALTEIVRRHESLRTTFQLADGLPAQVIVEAEAVRLHVTDLGAIGAEERAARAEQLIRAEAQRPFDLARDRLLRPALLRLAPEEHVLLMTMHHIVSDGWSMGVLIRELASLYAAFIEGRDAELAPLPVQYADFSRWQREWLQGETLERQLAYWRKQLADAPPTLNLPTDRPRPALQTFESAALNFTLPSELSSGLKALSQREGVTLFMTLLAAYNVLLHRYTGQEDILVGTGIANRNRTEIEGLIGFFVNMLVLRTDLSRDPSFVELLARVREMAFGAYAHQDVPFEKLVEELHPERDLSHTPFFQVTFVLQNASDEELTLPGLDVSLLEAKTGAAKFDLILSMSDSAQGLHGTLEYNTNLFDAATAERLLGHFRTLLAGIITDAGQPLSALPLLTPDEQQEFLRWNDTRADFPAETCIHHLFEAQAARVPDAVAVVCAGREVTYRELNARANRLAHLLVAQGVGPETLVGISVERSIEMVEAVLGVLKAGGAYVPLDPAYPRERLAYMLADARPRVLITQTRFLDALPPHEAHVVDLEAQRETIARLSEQNPASGATSENLAYVIYTSGSTGRPKGAQLQHRGLCNLSEAQLAAFGISPDARCLQFASLSFDASIFELVMAWRSGATLCLATQDAALPGEALARLLREQSVTNVTLPPSVLAVMPEEPLPALTSIIVAGEACSADLVRRWAKGRRFFNAYGPTETTVWASVAECAPDGQPPTIGRPIINAEVYLLDERLQPVPKGVPGELHIGGEGLARGYLNRPELTAERFIPHPFAQTPGARLYKTGDLARYLPDGRIDYLGRTDQQVKVRGFRIELGEIESVLVEHPGLRDAAVLATSDTPADRRLVAYIVPDTAATPPDTSAVRDYLSKRLPEYMVPAMFVVLDEMPLTGSGKVNRRALAQMRASKPESSAGYVAPRNETERIITSIWQEALQTEKISIDDNFFDLGGHSLLMVSVHNKLREQIKKDVPISDLFKYPTVRLLTAHFTEATQQTSTQSIRDRARKQKEAANRKRLTRKPGDGK